jgi:hypothetical protein
MTARLGHPSRAVCVVFDERSACAGARQLPKPKLQTSRLMTSKPLEPGLKQRPNAATVVPTIGLEPIQEFPPEGF